MPAKTHGLGGKERLYSVWSNMRNRCNNQRCKDYAYYGQKGIRVCQEWDDYLAFRRWAFENGYVEGVGLSIDRIDTDGDYTPSNCRIADKYQQMNNMTSNHLLTFNGETHTMAEWARIKNLPFSVIESRIVAYGWSVEKTLTTPNHSNITLYEYVGETKSLREWADEYSINYHTLYNRINAYGWSLDRALKTPVGAKEDT